MKGYPVDTLTVFVSYTRAGGLKLTFSTNRRPAKMSRAHVKAAGGEKAALAQWARVQSGPVEVVNA